MLSRLPQSTLPSPHLFASSAPASSAAVGPGHLWCRLLSVEWTAPRGDTDVFARIPDDPLVEILSRVPVKSVCQFKCVSKAWRDLIADPHHRKKLPQTLEVFFLMFDQEHCDSDSCCDDCDSDDGDGKDCDSNDGDGEDCDDDGDGEDCSADRSDGGELPCQGYSLVDVLGTSVHPVDFSFLTELGSIEKIMLLHRCNGLLLVLVDCNSDIAESYILCNPATKKYVSVPSAPYSGRRRDQIVMPYLLYHLGASSHFHLVEFWQMRGHHTLWSTHQKLRHGVTTNVIRITVTRA